MMFTKMAQQLESAHMPNIVVPAPEGFASNKDEAHSEADKHHHRIHTLIQFFGQLRKTALALTILTHITEPHLNRNQLRPICRQLPSASPTLTASAMRPTSQLSQANLRAQQPTKCSSKFSTPALAVQTSPCVLAAIQIRNQRLSPQVTAASATSLKTEPRTPNFLSAL